MQMHMVMEVVISSHQKRQWLRSPMHVPIMKQWWSYVHTRAWQCLQNFDRKGCRNRS